MNPNDLCPFCLDETDREALLCPHCNGTRRIACAPRAEGTGAPGVADETTACPDCQHQPYDHGATGCRVVRSSLAPCSCRRRRPVLERANQIAADLVPAASRAPTAAESAANPPSATAPRAAETSEGRS